MQTIVSVLVLLVAPSSTVFSYPVFGTKRYQRASFQPQPYAASSFQPPQLYSEIDPYASYNPLPAYLAPPSDDSYFYQPRRNERFHSYGLPTYHGESRNGPLYYNRNPIYGFQQDERDSTPLDDLHDEMMQEDEYERTRDSFPMGQEVWFEPPGQSQDSLTRANAAFLRNLMLYNSQFGKPNVKLPGSESPKSSHYNEYDYEEMPGSSDWYDFPLTAAKTSSLLGPASSQNSQTEEDKDVRELKELVSKHRKEHDSIYSQQNLRLDTPTKEEPQDYDSEYDEPWINWDSKRSSPKKVLPEDVVGAKKQPSKVPVSTEKPTPKPHDGQKEIVQPRPATPVRTVFRSSVLNPDLASNHLPEPDKKASPGAIYDTIKQMLAMEQKLDEKTHTQQKRYVSSEESLVQQLNGLKRHYSA